MGRKAGGGKGNEAGGCGCHRNIEMELTTEKLPQSKGEGGEGDERGERSS